MRFGRELQGSTGKHTAAINIALVRRLLRDNAPVVAPIRAQRKRCFLAIAAPAQRRPVSRDLLDNVDGAAPYGLVHEDVSGVGPSGGALDGEQYTADGSSSGNSYTADVAAPSAPTQGASAWGVYDSSAWSPQDEPLRPRTSPSGSRGEEGPSTSGYDANGSGWRDYGHDSRRRHSLGYGYANASEQRPLRDDAAIANESAPTASTTATTGQSPMSSYPQPQPPEHEADPADQPLSQPQQPSQHWPGAPPGSSGRRAGGADWGEADPITDWGGAAVDPYVDAAGWGSDFPAAVSRPAGAAGAAPGSGLGSSPGRPPPPGEETWPHGASTEPRGPRGFGQGLGAGSYNPLDGWEDDAMRDTQGAGYDAPGVGPGGASSAGRGGPAPPPPGTQGPVQPSDIVLLSNRDASSIIPLAPTSGQVEYFQPRSLQERIVQYLGSLGASVLLSKAAVLAGPALLYPIWSPWIRAGLRNLDVYSATFAAVGLWRAQVLDVQINGLAIGGVVLSRQPPTVSLLIGDPWIGGARASIDLPYQPRSELIRPGDSVELLVLCRDERFVSFKVVRELYFPQSGVWLCDYPFLNRDLFLAVSLTIERERRAAADAAAAESYFTYDVPYDGAAAAPVPQQQPAFAAGEGIPGGAGEPGGAAAAEGTGWERGAAGSPGPGTDSAGGAWPPPGSWQ